jgi:hypothetical protein
MRCRDIAAAALAAGCLLVSGCQSATDQTASTSQPISAPTSEAPSATLDLSQQTTPPDLPAAPPPAPVTTTPARVVPLTKAAAPRATVRVITPTPRPAAPRPTLVAPPRVAPPPTAAPGGSLGTAPIQKPPSGNFYRAGQYCPAVDSGKTTQDAHGRSLICTNNNGLRWEYA